MKYIKLPSVLLFFSFGGSMGSDRVKGSVHIPTRPVIGLSVRFCAAEGRIAYIFCHLNHFCLCTLDMTASQD